MKIETFEIELAENNTATGQVEAEALELIESLGLEGQNDFIGKDEETEVKRVIPYRKATEAQRNIIKLLFPELSEVSKFNEEPIPLRVLQVIAFVKQNCSEEMPWIGIHHVRGVDKDPVLIGKKSSWDSDFYLLARWGDALESWEKLQAKASKVWAKETQIKLNLIKAEIAAAEAQLKAGLVDLGRTYSFY